MWKVQAVQLISGCSADHSLSINITYNWNKLRNLKLVCFFTKYGTCSLVSDSGKQLYVPKFKENLF